MRKKHSRKLLVAALKLNETEDSQTVLSDLKEVIEDIEEEQLPLSNIDKLVREAFQTFDHGESFEIIIKDNKETDVLNDLRPKTIRKIKNVILRKKSVPQRLLWILTQYDLKSLAEKLELSQDLHWELVRDKVRNFTNVCACCVIRSIKDSYGNSGQINVFEPLLEEYLASEPSDKFSWRIGYILESSTINDRIIEILEARAPTWNLSKLFDNSTFWEVSYKCAVHALKQKRMQIFNELVSGEHFDMNRFLKYLKEH